MRFYNNWKSLTIQDDPKNLHKSIPIDIVRTNLYKLENFMRRLVEQFF